MANRSDFFKTSAKTPKIPRHLKKMLSLTSDGDKHHDGALRRLFIDAHQAHVAFKLKVRSGKAGPNIENDGEE